MTEFPKLITADGRSYVARDADQLARLVLALVAHDHATAARIADQVEVHPARPGPRAIGRDRTRLH